MTNNEWRADFTDAPQDGTEIEIGYQLMSGKIAPCFAVWSERPVCMLGPRSAYPPGWATGPSSRAESNLPLDPPRYWRTVDG